MRHRRGDDAGDTEHRQPRRAAHLEQRQMEFPPHGHDGDAVAAPALRGIWREHQRDQHLQPSRAHYSPFSVASEPLRSLGYHHLQSEQSAPPPGSFAASMLLPPPQWYNARVPEPPSALLPPPSVHSQHELLPDQLQHQRFFQLNHSGDDASYTESRGGHFVGGHQTQTAHRETRALRTASRPSSRSPQLARETLSPLRPPRLRSRLTASADSSNNSTPTEAAASGSTEDEGSSAADRSGKKRTRYLRDTDRRTIIQRIDSGEKQAALAREFGVTRAAICHIKKNREEIISRYDQLMQSAREMEGTITPPESRTNTSITAQLLMPGDEASVVVLEDHSRAVPILLTTLRDAETHPVDYRRAACRLIMILLEDAIAGLGSERVQVSTPSGHVYQGLQQRHSLCGVAIGESGFPFLKFFSQMEPKAARGFVHVDFDSSSQRPRTPRSGGEHQGTERSAGVDVTYGGASGQQQVLQRQQRQHSQQQRWYVERTDLPPHIDKCRVLLFSATTSDGERVRMAIEVLLGASVPEDRICVVTVLLAADAVSTLCSCFPGVKIVTAAIDSDVDPSTGDILPGLGDFVARYNSD